MRALLPLQFFPHWRGSPLVKKGEVSTSYLVGYDVEYLPIWRMCNNILFRGAIANDSSLVNQIIYISWFWFIGWFILHRLICMSNYKCGL
jgi:hypothetical protein